MRDSLRSLTDWYQGLGLLPKGALILGMALLTTAIAMAVVVFLPEDHFRASRGRPRHPVAHAAIVVLKNVAGIIILPLGVAMALPLVPGPGLVFILIGLSLLDFPGKRRLEQKLLDRPAVMRFINDLRTNFNRPPLTFDR